MRRAARQVDLGADQLGGQAEGSELDLEIIAGRNGLIGCRPKRGT